MLLCVRVVSLGVVAGADKVGLVRYVCLPVRHNVWTEKLLQGISVSNRSQSILEALSVDVRRRLWNTVLLGIVILSVILSRARG